MKWKISLFMHYKVPENGGFEQVKVLDMKWKITHNKVPNTDGFEQVKFLVMTWKTMQLESPGY